MSSTAPNAQSLPRDEAEEALVQGLARNDPRTVADFLGRTHRPVYAMSARLTADPDLRHDWTQDTLLKILEEMKKGRFEYRWPGCFWSWFQKRCHFLMINHYRGHRKRHDRLTPFDLGSEVVAKLSLGDEADPLRLMESVEARAILDDCLDRLDNEDHRRALAGILLEDQPYQAVADEMGATLNTVRSWIRRGREAVRRCVATRYRRVLGEE
ncbi:MAG: sigma-70 family RNA polymerase sigma factor [Candidatus Krumholzibacteriota bacterium]